MDVMKNLSDEEKQKLKDMSPEERMKFFQEKMGGDQRCEADSKPRCGRPDHRRPKTPALHRRPSER